MLGEAFGETLAGQRAVDLTEQRTRLDFAQTIRWLVDEVYPDARVIRLVMDNLNTHTAAILHRLHWRSWWAWRRVPTRFPMQAALSNP